MKPSLLYQDNMSAILLETNGKASSSKRTKHIKVKYFYILDQIAQNEITIEHCPTEQMWMDINTKPKQGAVFQEFRGQVMGISGDYVDSIFEHSSIYLRPPNSPVGYKPRDPTAEPTLNTDKSMLPVPKGRVAPQECVGEDTIEKPTDGGTAEVAVRSETRGDSDQRKEKAPLLLVRGVS